MIAIGALAGTVKRSRSAPTVLVIDDDARSDDPLSMMLRLDGFEIRCAKLGTEGLSMAGTIVPDAIVLDLHLPDVPGLCVLRRLRNSGVGCPIVAITGWHMEDRFELATRKDGANAFMRKPLDGAELARVLKTAIVHGSGSVVGVGGDQQLHTESEGPAQGVDRSKWLQQLQHGVERGDSVAFERLVSTLMPPLHRRLRRRFASLPDDVIYDAVEDAMIEYGCRPNRFDPSKGVPLEGYLALASSRNVLNRIDSERRRLFRETQYATQYCSNTCLPTELNHCTVSATERRRVLHQVAPTPSERAAVCRWLKGERGAAVLATALGLSSLTPREQEKEVKRFKDRVMKRLTRLRGRSV